MRVSCATSDKPARSAPLCAALLLVLAALSCGPRALGVVALLTDGQTVSGDIKAGDGEGLTLGTTKVPFSKMVSVDWGVAAQPSALKETVVFLNGDRVAGKIKSGSTASGRVEQTTSYGEMTWHVPGLSMLVFDDSPSTWRRVAHGLALAAYPIQGRPVPGDRILVQEDLVRATSQVFGRKDLIRKEVAFIVLTKGGRGEFPYRKPYIKVLLRNGDVLSGSVEKVQDGDITLKLPFYTFPAASVKLPVRLMSRLIVMNGPVAYLSDLTPVSEQNTPYLFAVTVPARQDAALTGGRLRVGGRVFMKGVCTRARTELVYQLDRKYSMFQTDVGVDDSVASVGGLVKFFVYAENTNGAPLAKIEPKPDSRGGPMRISVKVDNVSKLVLVTDWGPKGDIGAHGSWAGALLIKK